MSRDFWDLMLDALEQTTDEEDPYAAYVIPDDLMW